MKVAHTLAKRVVRGRMSYSLAEYTLMVQRCGPNYKRLWQAEREAAGALNRAFDRLGL